MPQDLCAAVYSARLWTCGYNPPAPFHAEGRRFKDEISVTAGRHRINLEYGYPVIDVTFTELCRDCFVRGADSGRWQRRYF